MPRGPVSHHQSLRAECTYSRTTRSCARSVKAQEGPSVAFLNWRFGLSQTTLWRIEVILVPDLSNVATPTEPIITIPIAIYGYGNGDDTREGGPERWCDGREHVEHKAVKERCRCEARSAYFFQHISCCSYRVPYPALS